MTHQPDKTDFDVAIVGAGFAGLGMAIELSRSGNSNFVVLEAGDGLGGVWRDNTYPGCACDIPSHLYCYSFAANPAWTRTYSSQAEILQYLEECATTYNVRPHLRFRHRVAEASFDSGQGKWQLKTSTGTSFTARTVVWATGALSTPIMPKVPGLENFAGKVLHTARWDTNYDLRNKTVALVGTGASGVQAVPHLQGLAQKLYVIQRTPPWILPRNDKAHSDGVKQRLKRWSILQQLRRGLLYVRQELLGLGFAIHPFFLRPAQRLAQRHLKKQVPDAALRAKLTPTYVAGCKRLLMSDTYYPALTQPNVSLVAGAVVGMEGKSLQISDGSKCDVDAVIFATGFDLRGYTAGVRIVGRDGLELNEVWSRGMDAYYGVAVAGFPNFFLISGPNSGTGHTSVLALVEAQARYVRGRIEAVLRGEARWVEVRQAAQDRYTAWLQQRLVGSVWRKGGCQSWYLDDTGKNYALWPGFAFEYTWRMTRQRAADWHAEPAAASTSSTLAAAV